MDMFGFATSFALQHNLGLPMHVPHEAIDFHRFYIIGLVFNTMQHMHTPMIACITSKIHC